MCLYDKKRMVLSKSKSGQFTIFVILGLVIMFAFGLAIYSRAKVIDTQLGAQADRQIKSYIDQNSINQYVTSCLDAVTENVIIRASLQGGESNFTGENPYDGYIPYYDADYNRTVNVSIIIDANKGCPDNSPLSQFIVTQSPPQYPYTCGNVPLDSLKSMYSTVGAPPCRNACTDKDFLVYSGFFGINSMPMLCDPQGNNRAGAVDSGVNYQTCDYYAYYTESMQQKIESEVTSEINKCVNFTDVLSRSPSNITFVGNVTANITFGIRSFNIKLEYPFTVMMYNRQPVTRMVDFTTEKNIPFKELYEFTYELANAEVKDIKFDVVNSIISLVGGDQSRRALQSIYDPRYSVAMIRGDASNNYTDIIQVTDTSSNIQGRNLKINFGIKNRRPALEYIHESQSEDYDILGVENETIILNPQGYDPDEETNLQYMYAYWKENYNDYFNYADSKCAHPTSAGGLSYIIANCSKINITSQPPFNWTNSSLFKSTNRRAEYRPTHLDVGFHNVSISVYDRAGLFDYQNVRILIFDLPKAVINGTNLYDDVPPNFASYEDMYILNGSESAVGAIAEGIGATLSTFIWNDTAEPFYRNIQILNNNNKSLIIPNATNNLPSAVNMMNIINYIFISNATRHSMIHNISLTVNTSMGLTNTAYFALNVTECVNHTSAANPNPYPYNNDPTSLMDALQADHRCCLDTMKYAPDTAQCYYNSLYGSWKSFKDYSAEANSPVTINVGGGPFSPVYESIAGALIDYATATSYPNDNNIFNQTFERFCSGDRGNVCTGAGQETRKVVVDCEDNNKGSAATPPSADFQKERCSGPPELYKNLNSTTSTEPSCEKYTAGKTFESIFGSGTGICTTVKKYATSQHTTNAFVGVAKNFICDGQCDGNGGCTYSTNCMCDSRDVSTTGSSECDNIPYPGNGPTTDGGYTHCNANSYEETCSACILTAVGSPICRSSGSMTDGCNANPLCDGHSPGHTPNDCVAGTNFKAKCSSSCQTTDFAELSGSRILHAKTSSGDWSHCEAGLNPTCNNQHQGDEIGSSTLYCKSTGQTIDCGNYALNVASDTCYTSCTDSSECSTAAGYGCDPSDSHCKI